MFDASLRLRALRTLVFDLECRPTAWFGGDYVGRSVTAAGWTWAEDGVPHSSVLTREMTDTSLIVAPIVEAICDADLIVGHFIRGFDLPVLSGEMERLGLSPFHPLLTLDTKLDRKQQTGLSESLENLVARYDLEHTKVSMSEPWWEEHNLWQTPRSVERVRTRVEGDVVSTLELYRALLEEGRFKGPKAWSPDQSRMPRYRG